MEPSSLNADDAALLTIMRAALACARESLPNDQAEDLSHDMVLAALKRVMEGRPLTDGPGLAWRVRTIVEFRTVDYIRQSRRRMKREVDYTREHDGENPSWMSPASALEDLELEEVYERILSELSPSCRRAYLMVREEGATYRQAAEVLGVSPSTVCSHVVTAQRKFRRALEELGIELPPAVRRSGRVV